ncbi:MAG TPA: adenosine deaminase [Actinophytocola sp.]|uniref:adenosine deaminase n=1 Tax=Actinophytocola sp. TaxID=1872138 RepID=UPI002DDD7487|nr:adenosine deaminase [Actinophytocola sp.]HEV2783286.1 adenosine deaminase [Actinophytocola sp.]
MRDLTRLPKVHLHVHLESTIRWSTLRELGEVNGVPVPPHPTSPLAFNGFREFGDYNTLIRSAPRRPEDFTRIALELCADEAAQGTRYAEVTFTAAAHGERLGDQEMPLAAVLDGLALGRSRYGIECRVLLDHSRRRSVDRAWQTLRLAIRYASAGVIGLGLAGDESHAAAPFAPVFHAAREAGLRLVHHAGETAGPASIREALSVGLADRLGHGIRVLDDPSLVAEVRDRAVPLEVCPSSNVALGLAGSLATHPFPRLLAAGLKVTLNTDIPNITGVTLTEEYRRVKDTFGYDDTVLAALNHAAIDASFAPAATKAHLHRETDAWRGAPSSMP